MKFTLTLKDLVETPISPASCRVEDDGCLFVDFGRAAFGTLMFNPRLGADKVVVHLGEKLDGHRRIDRHPPGTIRYRRVEQAISPGAGPCRMVIPPDQRNTGPNAILMPEKIGEVLPFRYAEIEDGARVDPASIWQITVHYPFDDEASSFESDNPVLNAVWEISKYTIKATTFCGVYVDGDRERIPYEGDAYINQLSHYGVDREYDFARYSHEYLIQKPTWCTEWHLHSVMMAWMDVMYSGKTDSLKVFYHDLCAKTLIDFARPDGLISVAPELRTPDMEARLAPHFEKGIIKSDIRDVMDWPPGSFTAGGTGERDNHEMLPISTVTNAFHAHCLILMARMSAMLGKTEQSTFFSQRALQVTRRINELLFDFEKGIYVDGEGSHHSSLHSNMFMLAFDLVPESRKPAVIGFVKSRGMACSVYGAQHLLDGLYLNQEAQFALDLMTATHDRSWWNMIQEGSTMTLEAWGHRYKNNLDWNHAWGAAPANIIPRFIAGVRPLEPGFKKVLIQPQPGNLGHFSAKVPTPLGPVVVGYESSGPGLVVSVPEGMAGRIELPSRDFKELILNGNTVAPSPGGRFEFN